MKRCLLVLWLLGAVLPSAALAEPYWVAWEGNDYPENEGWTRQFIAGGADRTLVDGVMRIDSTRDHAIYDQSELIRQVAPSPGELFIAEWRVRVNVSIGRDWDQGIGIASDTGDLLVLGMTRDSLLSDREGWSVPIEPDEYHAFRIASNDMRSYSLMIDGQFVRDGVFDPNTLEAVS